MGEAARIIDSPGEGASDFVDAEGSGELVAIEGGPAQGIYGGDEAVVQERGVGVQYRLPGGGVGGGHQLRGYGGILRVRRRRLGEAGQHEHPNR